MIYVDRFRCGCRLILATPDEKPLTSESLSCPAHEFEAGTMNPQELHAFLLRTAGLVPA